MKDHLFTMTPDLPGLPPEWLERMREEMQRNVLRMQHFSEMTLNPKEPEVGPTPREEIYRKNKSRLWRYASTRTVRTPLLFVPNLGISRPYIFDLMPKGSKNYIDMAGPIDFAHVGLFGLWLDPRFFDVDKYVDTLGSIPAEMVKLGFKLLKPTMDLSTNLNLWWNLWNPEYVAGFNALNKWANEYQPFPGEFFRQWVKDFYQQNKLIKGELTMGGRPVRIENIKSPVLAVGAKEDNIAPPGCVRPLIGAVSSRDREYVELPGGHISLIAGRGASVHCWPKVAAWLASRS